MRPKFAIAVDRLFAHVLELLARIGRGENVAPEQERSKVQSLLQRAEGEIGQGPEWDLTKFALVAWIDEVLITTSWEGCVWWKEHALEWEHFGTNLRATRFYENAKRASSADLRRRDALEVYYVAVVLGFGGIYVHSEAGIAEMWAKQNDLPPTLDLWLRQTSKHIMLGTDRPRIDATPPRPGAGAPPREGEALLINWSLIGVVLAAVTAILVGFNYNKLFEWISG